MFWNRSVHIETKCLLILINTQACPAVAATATTANATAALSQFRHIFFIIRGSEFNPQFFHYIHVTILFLYHFYICMKILL